MLLSAAMVYFRDVEFLIGIVLTAWFYVVPVIYSFDNIDNATVRQWMERDPVVPFINAYRQVGLLQGDGDRQRDDLALSHRADYLGRLLRGVQPAQGPDRGGAVSDREPAIAVAGVSKHFRIYRRRETTLKETLLNRRRGVYEEFTAVDDVSFEVPTGEALGIFGRNGSGKSTMLKMLARILAPDAGTIAVKGRVAALLEVGAGFHPEYSAIENIFLSGAIYGMSREDLAPRVDDIIAFAQLERFADNPVKTYSSGMYARLGFSIAVNVDPDVLLVDEVLAVGDESFRSRCYERMLAFREAGKTLILVTHDLGAIASFCSRAIWLDEGRVRGEGTPESITRRYVAEVTAQEELWSAQQAAAGRGLVTFHQPINDTVPISLSSMSIAAEDGTERDVFHNGEAIRVRIHYVARQAGALTDRRRLDPPT